MVKTNYVSKMRDKHDFTYKDASVENKGIVYNEVQGRCLVHRHDEAGDGWWKRHRGDG